MLEEDSEPGSEPAKFKVPSFNDAHANKFYTKPKTKVRN